MVGIKINTSDYREGDAPGPFYRPFDRLPVSYLLLGSSPTWLNWFLGALSLVILFTLGSITTFFADLGFPDGTASTLAVLCLVLSFASRPILSFLIRRIRAKQIHISRDQVIIERPNNPFVKDLVTPLREHRGLCRRWGMRNEGRREVKQEILELLHMDDARTIAVRVTEDHTSEPEEIALIAAQLGVDYLEDTFKKTTTTPAAPLSAPRPQMEPSRPKSLTPPPKGVRVENRVGASRFGTRISLDVPWHPFWSRVTLSLITAAAFIAGWIFSSGFLIAMGGMLFLPVAWRTITGSAGVNSLLVESNAVHLEPDNNCLLSYLFGRSATLEIVNKTNIRDVFTRRRQDGKRHELILLTDEREIPVSLPLATTGLNWTRDFVKQKLLNSHA